MTALLALYKEYKKSVNAHIAAAGAWAIFMLHNGTWPPTNDQWALLLTLVFPGLLAAVSTNVPRAWTPPPPPADTPPPPLPPVLEG